jgi:hypothetical protein
MHSSSRYQWMIFTGFVAASVGLSAVPAQAFFGFRFFSPEAAKPVLQKSRQMTEGQKVRVYKLKIAKAAELQSAIENRLRVLKSTGFVSVDASKNELALTDFPENLDEFDYLVREMDRAYDNANPAAREMLASEQMLKAVRAMNSQGMTSAEPHAGAATPAAAAASSNTKATAGTAAPWTASRPLENEEAPTLRWIVEDRPFLNGFRVLGWMRDKSQIIVVLRNGPERYFYSRGQIRVGSVLSTNVVQGIVASIQGEKLILKERDQGAVVLDLIPREHTRS